VWIGRSGQSLCDRARASHESYQSYESDESWLRHTPAVAFGGPPQPAPLLLATAVGTVPLTLAMAVGSHRWIEQPAIAFGRRLKARRATRDGSREAAEGRA
jgi:peptidoglycan/LPS O-acetylase OafA/YrhL